MKRDNLKELGDIAEFVNGFAFKPSQWESTGRRIIRIQNLTAQSKLYNRTNHEIPKKYHVNKGDLLVSWSASLGVFEWSKDDTALLNQHIFKVVPDDTRVHKLYLKYALTHAIASMIKFTHGSTMKHINRSEFLSTKIFLPEIEAQKRIAAILDKADAIRRKRQQAIKLADEFLRSVFLDMFGDPVTNPKGWKVEPFGKHVEELRYGSSVKYHTKKLGDSLPILRIPNITSARINLDNLVYAALSAKEISNLRLRQGDLLFVRTNGNPEYIGRCAVFQGSSDMLFVSYLIRARLRNEGNLLPEYIQTVISMKSFRKIIIKSAKTTAGNYNINTQGLRTLSVPVAPLNHQMKYVGLKKKLETLTAKEHLSDSSGLSLFGSLARRAFRGEL